MNVREGCTWEYSGFKIRIEYVEARCIISFRQSDVACKWNTPFTHGKIMVENETIFFLHIQFRISFRTELLCTTFSTAESRPV